MSDGVYDKINGIGGYVVIVGVALTLIGIMIG